jgi:hypothetical protein
MNMNMDMNMDTNMDTNTNTYRYINIALPMKTNVYE